MRRPAETDGSPGARAVTAASRYGAQTPLTEVSPVRELMRDLENTALAELDGLAARRITDVDRRFTRASSRLETELGRRQNAEPQALGKRYPVTLDASGFVAAAVGFGMLMAGNSGGPSIPTDGALIGAALCGIAAIFFHVTGSLRAARARKSNTQGWYLMLFSTILLFVSSAIGYWRFSSDPDAGFLVAATAIAVMIASGVFAAVLVARGSGARAAEAREKAERLRREDALRTDLREQLAEVTSVCRSEAERVFGNLNADARASLDTAVEAGIRAVEKRGILEPGALRAMRKSSRGELRYTLSL